MRTTININLNKKGGLENGIKELEAYKKRVKEKTSLLVQKLTDYGAEIVRIKIVNMGAYYSGALLSGVDGYYSPTLIAGFVKVASDHVAFVEFGTGVKGQGTYKNAEYLSKASWGYVTGGDKGKIFTTKDGRVGWYFPMDDGTWRFTEGMPSRPFMYETALELQRDFQKITQEVFST